jgi:hypothetical protein
MRPGEAMGLALRDLYENSWRFVAANAALGAVLVAVGVLGLALPLALAAVVLAGPLAAALVHMSVKLVRTGNVRVRDAVDGLRQHWLRGLALSACGAACVLLCAVALRFYTGHALGWPLAFLTLYLSVMFGLYQMLLWTLAIAEPARPLRTSAVRAAELFATRPGQTLLLGLGLLLVNVAGIAAALMPFLTVTVAYSCLAVARFALPRPAPEEPA